MRPIKLKVREGCFFNPKFPAPSGGRPILQIRIYDTINGALAKALPHRAMGAFSHWSNPNIGGIDDRTGQPFVMYDVSLAGYGGRYGKDGVEGMTPGHELLQHPRRGARDDQPHPRPSLRVHSRHRRRGAMARRLRHPQGHRAAELDGDASPTSAIGTSSSPTASSAASRVRWRRASSIHRATARSCIRRRRARSSSGDILSFRLSGAGGYGMPEKRDPQPSPRTSPTAMLRARPRNATMVRRWRPRDEVLGARLQYGRLQRAQVMPWMDWVELT